MLDFWISIYDPSRWTSAPGVWKTLDSHGKRQRTQDANSGSS